MTAVYCDVCAKPQSPNNDKVYTQTGGVICEDCRRIAANRKAFTILAAALTKDQKTTWQPPHAQAFLISHPLDESYRAGMVNFCGFGSDDIYPFFTEVCTPSNLALGDKTRFIFWMMPPEQGSRAGTYIILAEVRGEIESFMVAGMTNFSGSGSHAFEECSQVFTFLAALCGKTVEYMYPTWDQAKNVFNQINADIVSQMAESIEANQP